MEDLRGKVRKKCFGQLGKLLVQSARQTPVILGGTKAIEAAEEALKFYIPPVAAMVGMLMISTILETCLEEGMDRAYDRSITMAKHSLKVAPAILVMFNAAYGIKNFSAMHMSPVPQSSYARQSQTNGYGENPNDNKKKLIITMKKPRGLTL